MSTLKTLRNAAVLAGASLLTPVVVTATGRDLDDLLDHDRSRCAGIYLSLWRDASGRRHAYVGTAGLSIRLRLAVAPFRMPLPLERVVALVEDADRLTAHDAAALERIAWLAVAESEVHMIHPTPHGAVVSDNRYADLRRFWSDAAQVLKRAGILFTDVADRDLVAGPKGYFALPPFAPDARRFYLETKRVKATATVGSKHWRLEPGSIICANLSPHAAGVAWVRRQEQLYSGALTRIDRHQLMVAVPLEYASASAAARAVLGHAGGNPGLWRPIKTCGLVARSVPEITATPPATFPHPKVRHPNADAHALVLGGSCHAQL